MTVHTYYGKKSIEELKMNAPRYCQFKKCDNKEVFISNYIEVGSGTYKMYVKTGWTPMREVTWEEI